MKSAAIFEFNCILYLSILFSVSPLTCSIKTQKTKTFYLLYDLDYLGKVSWSDPNVASIWASPFLVVSERPVPSLAGPEPAVGSYIPPAIIQQTWFNTCKELSLENKGKIHIELVFHQNVLLKHGRSRNLKTLHFPLVLLQIFFLLFFDSWRLEMGKQHSKDIIPKSFLQSFVL